MSGCILTYYQPHRVISGLRERAGERGGWGGERERERERGEREREREREGGAHMGFVERVDATLNLSLRRILP